MNTVQIGITQNYNLGLNSVLSEKSTQEKIRAVLLEGGTNIVLPKHKEIEEIGAEIAYNGNSLGSGWSTAKIMLPTDQSELLNIYDRDNDITSMISSILMAGASDKSESPINDVSEEHEFKVLSIDFEDLKDRLLGEGFIPLYSARLYDVYNDFLDPRIRLDNYKAINRPRFKVGFDGEEKALYDRLLTLKRKLAEMEGKSMGSFPARKSYEREYLVLQNNFRALTLQQGTLGLQPMREKIKNRWAYIKTYDNGLIVKVDIDKYNGIDHLAEFEVSKTDGTAFGEGKNDDKNLKSILKKLGLSKNQIVGWGSRKLFIQNGIDYTHFFK